jgi:Zn-dependent protease
MSNSNKKSKLGVLAGLGLLLFTKLKWIIALLKFSKFGATFISMIIAMGTYAIFYGWSFAVALVYLIFVHEMGHLIAAKMKGIKTSPAIFIPFVGAVINMKEQPKNAKIEAFLAYGGPLAGFISFLPAIPLYLTTHNSVWALVIYLGATVNLFNLLPVSPLDGGRIIGALSPKIWLLGLLVMAIMLFTSFSPILLLIFIFGFTSWWKILRESFYFKKCEILNQTTKDYIESLITVQIFIDNHSEIENLNKVNEEIVKSDNELKILETELKNCKSFFIPFVQDKQKINKQNLQLKIHYLKEKINVLYSYKQGDSNVFESKSKEAIQTFQYQEKVLIEKKNYYNTTTKDKWITLSAYLGLALVLSIFYIYGQSILQTVVK